MNLRNNVTRGATATALLVAATALAVPQAMATATDARMGTELSSATDGTVKPLGRLGALTNLVIERLRVSDKVAESKFGTDSPIDDPAREEQVLTQVRDKASDLGVDPEAAVAFFQDQIAASKVVQKGLFARWTAHPEEAPTTRPDLGQIREQLDRLTTDLLQELKSTEELRDKPVACTVQLALAAASGAVREELDTLHRQALRTAPDSVCRPSEASGRN
ncbi:chorismate mutase [Streptomyces sp. KL116D]|uniref:chorismate mutase n=1 Tax=Streptomyces sp. KL116D TaxID=3045152 RepID=UPI003558AC7D